MMCPGARGAAPGLSGDVRQALARARPLTDEDTATIERMMENGASIVRTARCLGTTRDCVGAWVRSTGRAWPTKAERRRIHQDQHALAQALRDEQFASGARTGRTSTEQLTRAQRRLERQRAHLGSPEAADRLVEDILIRARIRSTSPEVRKKLDAALAEVRNQRATTKPSTSEGTTSSGDLIRRWRAGDADE